MSKKIIVIGAGFSGLTAASYLSKAGHEVTVLEKNNQPGGRAREWKKDGYTFDMGPSWYWMPEVFEQFYQDFGFEVKDLYDLKRLDPGYRVFYKNGEQVDVPANKDELFTLFEKHEKGSAQKLKIFLDQAEYKYKTAMADYVNRISDSILDFFDLKIIIKSFSLQLFSSLQKEVRSKFSNPKLVAILEFPVLFLGSTPSNTPALYSMMNYADLALGTWYPMGGMHQISLAFEKVAKSTGVDIKYSQEVLKISGEGKKISTVETETETYHCNACIVAADYEHLEQKVLDDKFKKYDAKYWDSRTMSPSSLLYYVGVDQKLPNLLHHNLFFDEDFAQHAHEIYGEPQWPSKPLFYASLSSKTDPTAAPKNGENLFLLMPLAAGLEDNEELHEQYFQGFVQRLEERTGESFTSNIKVKRSYCLKDFKNDYNSFKGNAYGLANTLRQTAFLKPKMRSSKAKNLFFTGQLTVPGPGVPPAIISGRIAAKELNKVLG
jgi:phytoene desaturase